MGEVVITASFILLQFIPARGRKRRIDTIGDEDPPIAIYPREGTETFQPYGLLRHSPIAIYPREGTETFRPFALFMAAFYCNLSPRGDGNIFAPQLGQSFGNCNLSPRGDGNSGGETGCGDGNIAIYPREGTETFCY